MDGDIALSGFDDTNPALSDGVNVPVDGWDPSNVNPAASSWDDVLKLGASRLVDAVTRPAQLNNAAPVLKQPAAPTRFFTGAPVSSLGAGLALTPTQMGMLLVAAALAAFLLLKKR